MSLVQGRSVKLFHLPAVDDSTSPGRKAPTGASGLILQKTLTGLCFHRRFLFAVSPLSRWLAPLHSQQSSYLPQLAGKLPHKSAQARTRTLICLVVSSQFSHGRIEAFQVHSMVYPCSSNFEDVLMGLDFWYVYLSFWKGVYPRDNHERKIFQSFRGIVLIALMPHNAFTVFAKSR